MAGAGLFLTFEGIEGAGKTTQIALLKPRIAAIGRELLTTREPGGTPIGDLIRKHCFQDAQDELAPLTETLLLGAARAEHMRRVILPALARGACVLSDRFADSTIAYQHHARGLAKETAERVNRWATYDRMPDKSFIFILPPNRVAERTAKRARGGETPSRYDLQCAEFHQKVQNGFLAIARENPKRCVLLDAALPKEILAEKLWDHARPLLKGERG